MVPGLVASVTTFTVHVNNPDGFHVYVGRAEHRAKNRAAHRGHMLANPFSVNAFGRENALARYEEWLYRLCTRKSAVVAEIRGLRGLRLGCWCAPVGRTLDHHFDDIVCHGQILGAYADGLCVCCLHVDGRPIRFAQWHLEPGTEVDPISGLCLYCQDPDGTDG